MEPVDSTVHHQCPLEHIPSSPFIPNIAETQKGLVKPSNHALKQSPSRTSPLPQGNKTSCKIPLDVRQTNPWKQHRDGP